MFDDFPQRIAGLLEAFTARVRAVTVEPVARVIKFITLGLVALALLTVAGIFFFVGLGRILGELVNKACDCSMAQEISYAIIGGLILIVAAFLWSRRVRKQSDGEGEA